MDRLLGIRQIERVHAALRTMGDSRPVSDRLLQHLEITHRVAERDIEHIPRKGPAVLVLNHPFGLLEGAVLLKALSGRRSDVKFLANHVLAGIPELRDLLIPVNPMGGMDAARRNPGGLKRSLHFLEDGGLLVVFPAGEVSHFQWKERSISDPPWSPAIARILEMASRRAAALVVIPVYVEGANSVLFQALGLLHPRLRTALLAREVLNKRKTHVGLRIGSPIPAGKLLAIPSQEERTQYLRWRTYLLASRQAFKPNTALPLPRRDRTGTLKPLAPAIPAEMQALEVRALPPAAMLARSGDLSVYIASSTELPSVLAEIGRLRELTFRTVGEGTGKPTDLDEFDSHYLHLFVWNEASCEVVGAYRLAPTDKIRVTLGIRGLYTVTLFDYNQQFLDRMGPALELGRSFVRAEYQKGFAPLLLLWKGIGKYVARNPRYKVLFGPVSISNQYHSISRELMVKFLEREASLREWLGLVATRNPWRPSRRLRTSLPPAGFDIEDLSAVVSDLEPSRAGVPVLLRQYLKLGGKLLGFNVDPKFSNSLDGLILVDLTRTEPKLLERYLGKSEAADFLAFQQGIQNGANDGNQQSLRRHHHRHRRRRWHAGLQAGAHRQEDPAAGTRRLRSAREGQLETPAPSTSRASTRRRKSGATATARSCIRTRTTASAATPSSTAPRCSACAARISARSATTAASLPRGRFPTTSSSRTTPQAERLYHVHGKRGEDPTEPPASAPYPYPAVSHEPRMQQLSEDFAAQGLRPFHTPLGIMLDEANPRTQQVHPLQHLRRLSVPGPRQVRRPGAAASIPRSSIRNVTLLTGREGGAARNQRLRPRGERR